MSDDGKKNDGGEVGQIAEGVGGVLDGISGALGTGEDTEDARRGLDAASDAVQAVRDAARTAQGAQGAAQALQRGNAGAGVAGVGNAVGGAAGGVGAISSGLGNVLDDPEARRALGEVARVANTAGGLARDLGSALDGAIDLASGLLGEASDVEYHMAISGIDGTLTVTSFTFHERLSELFSGSILARTDDEVAEAELLAKDVHLTIERGNEQRSLRGIVRSASVRPGGEGHGGYHLRVDIGPAVELMSHTVDSRIYQNITVPDLVEQLVQELVGSRGRKVNKDDLTETYPRHEYLVQYRESHIHFLKRLCDEEGIFFYFDHDAVDEDHEVLVLADSNENRPRARESFDGRVQLTAASHAIGHEVATHVDHQKRIGSTDTVVTGFDWSNPAMRVKQERTGRGSWQGPPLEVHDHFSHVRHYDYDAGGGQYQGHSAERHARLQTERQDVARQEWSIETTVVTAATGRTITLEGADDHDDEYVIVGVSARASANRQGRGEYHNSLEVVPKSVPYRPPTPPRRSMPGPETATVVGQSGEEITTDQHGRVHVQFHWDRLGERNEHSSAWIRVVQAWAGPGWGTIFIPRHGMEVLVQFIGGDPDRPIITGCVYNGDNRPPYPLPDEKTKSTIKTNSSTGGGGYNELRFEDKAGSEEVYIHAQKDFNEVVENNHSTHVKKNQRNTVDVNHTETVGGDQRLTVKGERRKTVENSEITEVQADRDETVIGNESLHLRSDRITEITHNETIAIGDNRTITIDGREDQTVKQGRKVIVKGDDELYVQEGKKRVTHVSGEFRTRIDQKYQLVQGGSEKHILDANQTYVESGGQVHIVTGGVHVMLKNEAGEINLVAPSKITMECGASKVEITPSSIKFNSPEIQATAGDSMLKLAAAAAQLKGAMVDVLGDMFTTIKGTLVRVN